MYKWIVAILLFTGFAVNAQELNCNVKINYERITDANTQVFKALERSLTDFVNNTRWTNRNFARSEKIDCSMFFNVSAFDGQAITAALQIQSSRPVYNSTYSTPIFNYNDKEVVFTYTEGQILNYNPNSFDSNLVSLIAYYANMIIGFDADTFASNGGTEYYVAAQNIVNLAQSSGYKGWGQNEGGLQNRYFMVYDVLSNAYSPFRETLYAYHINGLDRMNENTKAGKEGLISAVKTLTGVHKVRPNAFLTRIFFDAKSDELVAAFSGGPMMAVTELVDNLNRISPLNSTKWSNIK
ncbi:DUF4835 family protein [Flavobacterium sp. J372]|uniref:type IX secretion system protein PorD n=1 Tax=Flavobacterium sp. J372 TaxID=2898436 RepID=UPI002151DF7C|nr:DUF4835 family protein [Flavobacterium sp. J372]MCR5862200.1 DUF4835 family protein [Flavobacterium sp. J372]